MELKRDEDSTGSLASRVRSVPIFLNEKNKFVTSTMLLVAATILYLSANHFPIFPPQQLPVLKIDRIVPFVPLTIWIYVSEYLYFFVLIFLARDLRNLNKLIYGMLILQFLSCGIFWLWPTTYPRDLFPLPIDLDPISHAVFTVIREIDTPNNCCPSLHVSSVMLCCFSYMDMKDVSRKMAQLKYGLALIWAIAIAVSTLTTKQHYLIDIVSGTALAYFVYIIQFKLMTYHYLPTAAPELKGVSLADLVR